MQGTIPTSVTGTSSIVTAIRLMASMRIATTKWPTNQT
jgi:hypothetical protein